MFYKNWVFLKITQIRFKLKTKNVEILLQKSYEFKCSLKNKEKNCKIFYNIFNVKSKYHKNN